jgi:hypothetical protein
MVNTKKAKKKIERTPISRSQGHYMLGQLRANPEARILTRDFIQQVGKGRSCVEEKYFVSKEQHAFALDPNIPPVLEVTPPCTVTFETGDMSYARLAQGETIEDIGFQNFNVVTGPVFVHGAEPGDALCVEVLRSQCEVPGQPGFLDWVGGVTKQISYKYARFRLKASGPALVSGSRSQLSQ